MTLRIKGLVGIARRVQDRLQAGIEASERAAFLDYVQRHIQTVDAICARHGVTPQDLPAPSKRAYEALTRIRNTRPEDLPPPRPDGAAVKPIRITRIVAKLKAVLADLGDAEPMRPVETRRATHDFISQVRSICAGRGTTPAGLPARSGMAFGMLCWLAEAGNAERYAETHGQARELLLPILRARRPGNDTLITMEPGRHLYGVSARGQLTHCKLSVSFLAADRAALQDLAAVIADRRAVAAEVRERHLQFIESEEAVAMQWAMETHWQGERDRSRGTAYDLGGLFAKLNATYFEGRMKRPLLEWRPSLSRTRFGFYVGVADRVVIDARLDDPNVPELVAECVLFHELLHKHYGTPHVDGRRQVHPPHFLEHERQHPQFEESERWLVKLARGGAPA
jgi:hypothetical protein